MTDSHSPDLPEDLKQQLQALVPAAFKDGQLDADTLQQLLGVDVASRDERYGLNWAGKADSYKALQYPTSSTLRPRINQSVGFEHAQHVFIEGENLEVLKVLQRAYFGKVKMIYIDPPYNTGSDSFIYPDRFQESREDYLKRIESLDIDGNLTKEGLFRKNSKDSGHYHSNWLSMMLPRLYLARNLMRDDGLIFISIDETESGNLKLMCNEIFGEENFFSEMVWKNKTGGGAKTKGWIGLHEYILCYAKNIDSINDVSIPYSSKTALMYNKKDEHYSTKGPYATWPLDTTSMDERRNLRFPIYHNDVEIWPVKQWLWSQERVVDAQKNNMLVFNEQSDGGYKVRFKGYLLDENGVMRRGKPLSLLDGPYSQEGSKDFKALLPKAAFPFPKPVKLLKQLLSISTNDGKDKDSIVLDFFAGSATTAQAVIELNIEDGGTRKYICVQMPEPTDEASEAYVAGYKNIADISHERIRRAINHIKKNADLASPVKENDPNLGFRAFALAPSNFKQWRGDWAETAEELDQQLALMLPTEKRGATSLDMAFELLLKNGRPLVSRVELKIIVETPVYIVWSQDVEEKTVALIFVLESMQLEALETMLALKPKHIVFLDSVFNNNDSVKVNVALQCESAGVKFSSI